MRAKTIPIKNGTIRIPDELRERYGLDDDTLLVVEAGAEGILLRPEGWPGPEIYTPERIAEFLLNNAIDEADYQEALKEVRQLGVDPDDVPHDRPNA